MFNITNIPQKKFRNREHRDANGKLVRTKEEYWGTRTFTTAIGFDRFTHYFVDCIAINLLQFAFTFVLNLLSSAPLPFGTWMFFGSIFTASGLCIAFCYYLFFEWKLGTTPGKMIMGKVVINKFADKPDLQTIATRSLIRFIPFEAFSCFSDLGWHDKWSETFVVTKEEQANLKAALQEANDLAAKHAQQQQNNS